MVTSIIQDLRVQPLGVKPFVGTGGGKVVADADGYFYKRGTPVKITGDRQVGVAGINDASIGVLETGIHKSQAPNGLDDRHRLAVTTPFNYLIRGIAGPGGVVAGTEVQMGADGKYVTKTDKPTAGVVLTGAVEDGVIEILI